MKIKYFTEKENIEKNAIDALEIYSENSGINSVSVFPDIHFCSEKALPVGVAFESKTRVFPLITGKDMGCGVAFLRMDKSDVKPFNKHLHYQAFDKESLKMTDEGLGGGNHFLSFEHSDKYFYIIVHTGSRNLGIAMFQNNWDILQSHDSVSFPIENLETKYINDYNKILDYSKNRRFEFLEKSFKFLVKNKYVSENTQYIMKDSVHNYLEFKTDSVIHRKGSTGLIDDEVVIPISMSRGSLIVKPNIYHPDYLTSLQSCSHGAGRKLTRTDTLKFWHSLKKSEKEKYMNNFSEVLENDKIPSSIIQEMDFAYKDSSSILSSQQFLIKTDETIPVITVKLKNI